MQKSDWIRKSEEYLSKLCLEFGNRAVGSEGNQRAAAFFSRQLERLGWERSSTRFQAMDWREKGAELACGSIRFEVFPSPYSLGCDLKGKLTAAGTMTELEKLDAAGKVVLLFGDLAREQIMPKNFVFYHPEEHRRIVFLLEQSGALALVCATTHNPLTAGGVYPFPLFEDGDFDIPSVFMTDGQGKRLLRYLGRDVHLESRACRIPSFGENIVGRKGPAEGKRIAVTAHIDAKKGTPGAIDNATGVIVLLLLAEMLGDYKGRDLLELVAFNGEDYYAVPGQMAYLEQNRGRFGSIRLNINIDGAGYREGGSCFSLFNLPGEIESHVRLVMKRHPVMSEGAQWVQGDHSIFVQQGSPAVAVTSRWFLEHMVDQKVTHTPADHPDIVSCSTLADTARAVAELIRLVSC